MIHFWDTSAGDLVYTIEHLDAVMGFRFYPDGTKLVVRLRHFIKVWDLCSLNPDFFKNFCKPGVQVQERYDRG